MVVKDEDPEMNFSEWPPMLSGLSRDTAALGSCRKPPISNLSPT